MQEAINIITKLQRRMVADVDLTDPVHDYSRLLFIEAGGLLHVEFYGDSFDEPFTELLEAIAHPAVAERLAVLHFDGPDEGANGTKDWDFSPLLTTRVTFPKMTTFRVALSQPGDHNQSILSDGSGYDEGGIIARLLDRLPNLRNLTVPSAPDASFFRRAPHPLTHLTVDTGYDHQDFILNMSQADCFPQLLSLDFGDFGEWYMDDYPADCVPFEHYRALFQSPSFASVRTLVLRNAPLSEDQIGQLKALKPSFFFRHTAPCHPKTLQEPEDVEGDDE